MRQLFDPQLLDALEESVQDLWEGTLWRQVVGTTDPLQTNGLGGRWNPSGVEVLYCSLSRQGAEAELRAVLDRQPVPIKRPRRTYQLSARLSKVGRATDSAALVMAGVTLEDVVGPDWSVPQLLGAAADWLGLAGLIVPSARHEDGNLVIVVNRLAAGDYYEVSVEDEGQVPRQFDLSVTGSEGAA